MAQAPLSIISAGYYNWASANLLHRGDYAHYWTSTSSNALLARNLTFYDVNVYLRHGGQKVMGYSVRCVAQ